jgi:hypothetical protein
MLSRAEWMHEADRSGALEWGRRHPNLSAARHGIVPVSLLILIGAAGWGAWWLWSHLTVPSMPEATDITPGLPSAFWVVAALVLVGTVFTFRPRSTPTPAHLLIVKVIVAGLVWLGLSTYALAFLAS